ncbi:hypothetical protein KQH82_01740 [bacterium]|nr:hypothetical protein [bacterium]
MASYRSITRRALLALLTLSLIVCCTSTTNADVALPAEFYFGRWAQGLSFDASGHWTNEQPPNWYGTLTYTHDRYRAGVSGYTRAYNLYYTSYEDHAIDGFARWRATDNWQVGIDRIGVQSYDREQHPFLFDPEYTVLSESDEYGFAASSHWSRRDTITLSDNFARYAYYVGPTAGPGDLVWYTLGQFSHEKTGLGLPWYLPLDPFVVYDTTTTDWWNVMSDLVWGISEEAFVKARLNLVKRSIDEEEYRPVTPEELELESRQERSYTEPSYDLSAVFIPAQGAFVTVGVGQDFQSYSRKDTYYTFGEEYADESDRGLKLTSTTVRVSVDAITQGEFNPQILLDDYLDFYHGILARNQQHVHFGIFSEWPRPNGRDSDDRYAGIDLGSAIGIGSGAELATALEYRWDRTTYTYYAPWYFTEQITNESVRWMIGVRWRSYEFTPGTGPGWTNDSPMDIAFGAIPRANDFYVSFVYQPPALRGTDTYKERSFLSLSGLENDGIHHINGRLTAGVGAQATVSALVDLLATDGSNSWDLTLAGSKRIKGKFQVSVEASRTRADGDWNDPELTLRVAGLL